MMLPLEKKMIKLKRTLLEYATHIEKTIEKTIKGINERNLDYFKEIINSDEIVSNKREIILEELCIITLAQFQPRAKDLRTILMIYKIKNNLERIGDHSVNICDSSIKIINKIDGSIIKDVVNIAKITKMMLNNSINSFVNENIKLAFEVCNNDTEVDNLRKIIFNKIVDLMKTEPENAELYLHLDRISRNYERIADLTTNISEDVVFIVDGDINRRNKIIPLDLYDKVIL